MSIETTTSTELAETDARIVVRLPSFVSPVMVVVDGTTIRLDLPESRHVDGDEWRELQTQLGVSDDVDASGDGFGFGLGLNHLRIFGLQGLAFNDSTRELSFIVPAGRTTPMPIYQAVQLALLTYLR